MNQNLVRLRLFVLTFFAVFLLFTPLQGRADHGFSYPVMPGEVMFGLMPSKDDPAYAARIATPYGRITWRQPRLHAYKITLNPGLLIKDVMAKLRQNPDVRYAAPNGKISIASVPNDPSYSSQYGPKIAKAEQAWDIWQPTSPVVVAVIDTGTDYTHPDLANKILRDGMGQVIGKDTYNYDDDPMDDHGHGTHCAGIAAAQINNGVGIAGVAGWDGKPGSDTTYVKIMPVKCLSSGGGASWQNLTDSLMWVADVGSTKVNGAPIVISMSLGGTGLDPGTQDAIAYTWSKGILIIAAAGNNASNGDFYPAQFPNVLSVAATDNTDTLADFSNWGPKVDVAAPGVNVYSTFPGNTYGAISGTSMACPHVAGEAALILAQNPSLTATEAAALIVTNVDPYTPISGHTIAPGAGRINIFNALQAAGVPGPPELDTITIAPGTVVGGGAAVGTVNLTRKAPAGGSDVALESDNGAATVPAAVTVPEGEKTATFPITTSSVAAVTPANITATYNAVEKSAQITIQPLMLASFSVAPKEAACGGVNVTGYVTLNGPAKSGGFTVNVSSSNPSVASVPTTATIASGQKTASFSITITGINDTRNVVITVSANGIKRTDTLTVMPLLAGFTIDPTQVAGGKRAGAKITISLSAGPDGAAIQVVNGNPGAMSMPNMVVVPPYQKVVTFQINTFLTGTEKMAHVTVSGQNSSRTALLKAMPIVPKTVTFNPGRVLGGTSATANVTLNYPAPAGGALVTFSTSNSAATPPLNVKFNEGVSMMSVPVKTNQVADDKPVLISAAYNGVTAKGTLVVGAPGLNSLTVAPNPANANSFAIGTVTLDVPGNKSGTNVFLSSSDPSIASVPNKVTVYVGSYANTFTVVTKSITTTKEVTITAWRNGVTRTFKLQILAPRLATFSCTPATIKGGGSTQVMVSLTTPAPPGGAAVTLVSSNKAAIPDAVIMVPGGRTSVSALCKSNKVAVTTNVTVSAGYGGITRTVNVTVVP